MNPNQTHAQIASTGGQSLPRVFKILVEGISAHSVKGHPEDHTLLRNELLRVSESIEDEQTLSQSILQAKAAVHALREYSQRTDKRLHLRETEQAAVVQLLLETLEDLRIASPEKMQQLKEIGSQLTGEADVEQLRVGRLRLADCLARIGKEAERQWTSTNADAQTDFITHLPDRTLAEAALAQACASDIPRCAVVLVVNRIELYNRRYGRGVGDLVLRFFADSVKRSFGALDRATAELFRWTGPALLLLLPGATDKVADEVRSIMEPRLQYELDTSSRTVLLSIESRWSVFPLMVAPRLLVNKIDAFVS